ncbi:MULTISPECIES: UDP-N-acetylmuramate--L-alanine ligase [Coprobacillaceae]|uniref:UDP-N-acetylmuramate--L-alanine ligase n=1 Tax=Coprobacillaceae TaxID=2810280 RepID=UPI000E5146DA|nr:MULTISPECIES: Mur ligase family protein [Coprobacillaceae]RHM62592.1 UDP-N-acetylmuramate--alanine ligase [Coprobacillus sp. AF33-1AC]RHS93410.1 UDP-N-acetylmuramate--alanine ligase [Erysipelatoclostridium sp. AM42-17]
MYYFIGIKGSGMAPLATILYELGNEVCGSDIDKYIFIEDELRKRNIPIYSFDANNIKDGYTVIIGNAFDETNVEVKAALANPNVTCYRYFEFLGQFMENYISISVAGTHGKTTTTGMAYHLFEDFDKTSVLIGDGTGHGQKDSKYFIAESCEFQDHFLNYYPNYAIINNIELDHVDYFGNLERYIQSFEKFANQVKDTVIVWGDDPNIKKIHFKKRVMRFGLGENNDVRAVNVVDTVKGLSFDVYIHQELFGHFNIPLYGMHMLYNSLAIITLGYLENMSYDYILNKLQTFKGTKRRYTVTEDGNNIYVDDYAHHPTAIKYVIEATRVRYPGKEIVAIFQPDRFSRGARFAKEFAASMDLADHPYFVPFPDNAKHEDGIDIDIYDIAKYLPRAKVIEENEAGAKELSQYNGCVFLFMSSKDIYKFEEKVIEMKKTI